MRFYFYRTVVKKKIQLAQFRIPDTHTGNAFLNGSAYFRLIRIDYISTSRMNSYFISNTCKVNGCNIFIFVLSFFSNYKCIYLRLLYK